MNVIRLQACTEFIYDHHGMYCKASTTQADKEYRLIPAVIMFKALQIFYTSHMVEL